MDGGGRRAEIRRTRLRRVSIITTEHRRCVLIKPKAGVASRTTARSPRGQISRTFPRSHSIKDTTAAPLINSRLRKKNALANFLAKTVKKSPAFQAETDERVSVRKSQKKHNAAQAQVLVKKQSRRAKTITSSPNEEIARGFLNSSRKRPAGHGSKAAVSAAERNALSSQAGKNAQRFFSKDGEKLPTRPAQTNSSGPRS